MRSHVVPYAAALAVVAVAAAVAGAAAKVWWLAIGAVLALLGANLVAVVWAGVTVQTLRSRGGAAAPTVGAVTLDRHQAGADAVVEANRVLQAALTARLERLERAVEANGTTRPEVGHER